MFDNLCDVAGVRVGHATDLEGLTGCTVVLFDSPTVVGGDVRGASPGTRETDLLHPVNSADRAHGLLLTGGSSFGLAAADGVVRYLEENGEGFDVGIARIPAVPGAVVFDLRVGSPEARPDAAMGYEAAAAAESGVFDQGNVGAGTGVTVGKLLGVDKTMKGGLGSVSVELAGGLIVAALAVVNALGDVRDPKTGDILAGPRLDDGTLGDSVDLVLRGEGDVRRGENTTLGVVATNAKLTKAQATRVAWMAHDGLARAIYPVHTQADGDTTFAAATGEIDVSEAYGATREPVDVVGSCGAYVVQEAILQAVRAAESIPGVPAMSDIKPG